MTSKAGAVDVGEPPLLVHGPEPHKGGFITSLGEKAHCVFGEVIMYRIQNDVIAVCIV